PPPPPPPSCAACSDVPCSWPGCRAGTGKLRPASRRRPRAPSCRCPRTCRWSSGRCATGGCRGRARRCARRRRARAGRPGWTGWASSATGRARRCCCVWWGGSSPPPWRPRSAWPRQPRMRGCARPCRAWPMAATIRSPGRRGSRPCARRWTRCPRRRCRRLRHPPPSRAATAPRPGSGPASPPARLPWPPAPHAPLAWQARQQALREALDTLPAAPLPTPPPPAPVPRSHRATPWLWAGVAACALALAATFLPLRLPGPPDPDGPPDLERAESDPLPPSQAPEVALAPDLVLLSHPDLEQLANAEDAVVVDELGLYAWYAARLSRDARSRGGEGDGGR